MTGEYAEKLEAGLEFQDFVMRRLHALGIVLQTIGSKSGQLKGENLLGLEIKFDRKRKETGNLYIETHEKSNAENRFWICSGILRDDNSWLYGIGDRECFWIFGKKHLRTVYQRLESNKLTIDGVRVVSNPTSKGFLIPSVLAGDWAQKTVLFSEA